MTFLSGSNVVDAVNELIARADWIRVAVAYWGDGASQRFHFDEAAEKDVIIVCDLMSGACNPKEIEILRKSFGDDRVLTLDRLHAKVWVTEHGAIVGSSNASANGLGLEGTETAGSIEANILIRNNQNLAQLNDWFETDILEQARKITATDMKEARRRWKWRRSHRLSDLKQATLFDAVRDDPSSFQDRDFKVWIWDFRALDPWAEKKLESERSARHNSSISCWENFSTKAGPGGYILEFVTVNGGDIRFEGLSQILHDSPFVETRYGTLLLCKEITKFEGLGLGSLKLWKGAAVAAAKRNPKRSEWDIADFSKFLQTA